MQGIQTVFWIYILFHSWPITLFLMYCTNFLGPRVLVSTIDYLYIYYILSGHLVPFVENTSAACSVLSILAINMDRYLAICKAFSSIRTMSTKSDVLKVVVCLWIVSMVSCIPFILFTAYIDVTHLDGTKVKKCGIYTDKFYKKCYMIIFTSVFYVIPCVMLCVLHDLIAKFINKEKIPPNNTSNPNVLDSRKTSMAKRRQAIYLLKTITSVFFLCLLPLNILRHFFIFGKEADFAKLGLEGYLGLLYFARVMLYLNSCINPIVYNILSRKFRLSFKQILSLNSTTSYTNRSTQSQSKETMIPLEKSPVIIWSEYNIIYFSKIKHLVKICKSSDILHSLMLNLKFVSADVDFWHQFSIFVFS